MAKNCKGCIHQPKTNKHVDEKLTALEFISLPINGDLANYVLINGHIVVQAGASGTLAISYDKLELFIKELVDIADTHSDFLKQLRVPFLDRTSKERTKTI